MPLILGMDFLVKVSPSVDWKNHKVTCYVGNRKYVLPTCSISNIDTICDHNTFAGLSVDNEADSSDLEQSDDAAISKNSAHVAPHGGC